MASHPRLATVTSILVTIALPAQIFVDAAAPANGNGQTYGDLDGITEIDIGAHEFNNCHLSSSGNLSNPLAFGIQ